MLLALVTNSAVVYRAGPTAVWIGGVGWWATIPVVAAMLVITGAAAAGGYWVALRVPRRNVRARGPFLVGIFCGVMVGAGLTARRHGFNAVAGAAARALPVALSILRRKPETSR
ncbi:MAG: hypothetical protein KDB50_03285 [Mycobacterium sp.]|nr:hypothetical protein [Mycobacterium sp.]